MNTAETGGMAIPYMPGDENAAAYGTAMLGIQAVGVPMSEPAQLAEEQGAQGVGSSGEVNEEGQTTFV